MTLVRRHADVPFCYTSVYLPPRIDRLYFDAEDTPVELAVSYFDSERYSYRVKLRRRAR